MTKNKAAQELGKKRWSKTTKKDRNKIMTDLANKRWSKSITPMSKLDELVKNWLSQGKAREWTEVVELIEKLQEQARLDEREAMKKKIEMLKAKYTYNGYKGSFEDFYADLLNELNKN